MNSITAMPYQPSLKCMLFGGYVPPEVPGRVHKLEDPLSQFQLSALNRKRRVVPSPKRDAIINCLSTNTWVSVATISKKTGSTTEFIQKHIRLLLADGMVERRKIEQSKTVRWYEYRLVSESCK